MLFRSAICAKALKEKNALKQNAVVGTVMTNMGFNKFCDENNMKFVATPVGDRYVLENMLENDYNIGGEQSGHIIFLDYSTTGDGQLTSVQLLSIIKNTGKPLSQLAGIMKRFPQVLINVKVATDKKDEYYTDTVIKSEIEKVKEQLNNKGRILVRPSGTEPLIRVMLEGEDYAQISEFANTVADLIRDRLS